MLLLIPFFRVNGRKIAYGHYPFKSGYPYPVGRCFETQGRDDMGGICLGLMENVNETAKLWVASVSKALYFSMIKD